MLVGLSGTVIDAPVGALVADAHEVDFGTVTVAAVTKQGLTLRNTGSASAALAQVCQFSAHFATSSAANPHGCWVSV